MGQKRARTSRGTRSCKRTRRSTPETDLDYISRHDYVIINDFMYVRPYVFEYKTNFKPRWRNQTILDVFRQEFKHTEHDYWEREIEGGRILANGKKIATGTLWEDGIEVVHLVHRHESAVLSSPIHITQDEDGFIVVSKPSSLPVHPCGTYRRNSLQFIMKAFHGTGKLFVIHRLDKETSGLVILAKKPDSAAKFSAEIKEHKVQKTYLAEVHGLFPVETSTCEEPLYWDKREMKGFVRPDGLEAKTLFKLLSQNRGKGTSVVECQPHTGRTHQIRIHLAHMGFPVVNDPLYGNHSPCENTAQVAGSGEDPLSITLDHSEFVEDAVVNESRQTYLACNWSQWSLKQHGRHLSCLEEGQSLSCANCPQVANVKNVELQQMFIHLHALKYESDDWAFEVPPPHWAQGGKDERREDRKAVSNSLKCAVI